MKTHLFIAGVVVAYVTTSLIVMRQWIKQIPEAELTNKEAIKLGMSLEQMRNGDLVEL